MAMPGILQQIARANPMMQKIKQMMGMIGGAQDPQAMINQLMINNPQMKQAMEIINQAGGDPKKAFYSLAEQKGVNPDDIINLIRN